MNSQKDKLLDRNSACVIAMDGPSGSGKGHIAKKIAELYSLKYFESSQAYRGLAFLCLKEGVGIENRERIIELSSQDIISLIAGEDLYTNEISVFSSKVAQMLEVRDNITKMLRAAIKSNKRIIMEGRDIATVVVPEADIKIFITATAKIRADRRFKQLQEQGKPCILQEVFESILERDMQDTSRDVAPLAVAKGALIIDTTELNPDQVIDAILERLHS